MLEYMQHETQFLRGNRERFLRLCFAIHRHSAQEASAVLSRLEERRRKAGEVRKRAFNFVVLPICDFSVRTGKSSIRLARLRVNSVDSVASVEEDLIHETDDCRAQSQPTACRTLSEL